MSLPFTMSIAGSIPLLLCMLLWAVQKDHFSVSFGLLLLKISMFFYLVPVQLLYYILPNSFYYFFKFWKRDIPFDEPIRMYYRNELVLPYKERFLWIPRWFVVLFLIWIICVFIALLIQIRKYRKAIKPLHSCIPQTNVHKTTKKIRLLKISYSCTAYSIGFFKSYIVFSKDLYESDCQEELFRHELCHIKNRDIWIRVLCLIVICIHFYNPLAYLLFLIYHILSECACDLYAVKESSPEKKKQYAQLLVELSGRKKPSCSVLQNSFSSSKFCIKQRINYIMKNTTTKHISKITLCILTVLSVILSATTIFAYEPPKTMDWNPQGGSTENCFVEFTPSGYINELTQPAYLDFSKSDIVFITENGKEFPIFDNNISLRKSCVHNLKTGILNYHNRNSSGGCTVTAYKVTRCTKCGYEKSRTYLGSSEYPICPH